MSLSSCIIAGRTSACPEQVIIKIVCFLLAAGLFIENWFEHLKLVLINQTVSISTTTLEG